MGMLLHRHTIKQVQAVEKPSVPTKKEVPEKKSITKKELFGVSKQKLIDIAEENGVEIDEEAKAQDIKKAIIDSLGL